MNPHPTAGSSLIGITLGDPAGVGPEVVAGALKNIPAGTRSRCLLIGDPRLLNKFASKRMLTSLDWIRSLSWNGPLPKPGRPSREGARYALACLEYGTLLALKGGLSALVTAPVSKEGLHGVGFRFPGVTEYLAYRAGVQHAEMLFLGGPIRVVLATRHVPFRDVSRILTTQRLARTIERSHRFVKRYFKIAHPRVAVLGLNPHAGEGGLTGREEKKVIRPAIARARRRGFRVEGPLSPDSAFWTARRGSFDVVVAMYHDQGLIPLKMLAFDRAVNVTIGLPFIRTAPDHGTAFDIAGKGKANPRPMLEAIRWAVKLSLKS
ncbi:MAG: 4-hydroxythreonine-4-phosphate dehydrogenase PdxA [Candidatus Omnitrophica bacterium]|nr:4-hydroxythreonine-4-phosphate dehydrogenase PdxA [Candidatus Omnitrophota bacterium]